MSNILICEQFPLFDLTSTPTPHVCFSEYKGELNIHVNDLPKLPSGAKLLHLGQVRLERLECGSHRLYIGDLVLAEYGQRTTTIKANHLKGVGIGLINFLRDVRETYLDPDF